MTQEYGTYGKNQSVADGVNANFYYTFDIYTASEVLVIITNGTTGVETTKVLNTDYTVNLGTKCVAFVAAPSANDIVTLIQNIPFTQMTDYTQGSNYNPESFELGLDRSCIRDLQLLETLSRCLKFSRGYGGSLPDDITGETPITRQFLSRSATGVLEFYDIPTTVMEFTAVYDALVAAIALKVAKTDLQSCTHLVGTSVVGTDAYAITLSPVPSAYTNLFWFMKADVANTGACTINVNGLGVIDIKRRNASGTLIDPSTNDIVANQLAMFMYDTTSGDAVLLNPNTPIAPNDYKSGDVVQEIWVTDAVAASGTDVIPIDSTKPQKTEGASWKSQVVTMVDSANYLEVDVMLMAAALYTHVGAAALFVDAEADCRVSVTFGDYHSGQVRPVIFPTYRFAPASATVTLSVRVGVTSGGNWYLNQTQGGHTMGGTMVSVLKIKEIKA